MSENTSIALLSHADHALMEADTIVKLKELKNMALTASDWLKRKNAGEEIIKKARNLALDAERKMGEMLKATERAKGGQAYRPTSNSSLPVETPPLSILGISKRESADAQILFETSDEMFKKLKTGKTTRKNIKKAA